MIAIIDYEAGNIGSVRNALDYLGYESIITQTKHEIVQAEKVVFPGVGEAQAAMASLKNNGLDVIIRNLRQPVLGICLGMQVMCKTSEEGNTACLGIFDTHVKQFLPKDKVPHVRWNNFTQLQGNLFKKIYLNDDVYFLHSYYAALCEQTVAQCDYILPFSAALQKNNFYATQFHPEKSAKVGMQILQNFLNL